MKHPTAERCGERGFSVLEVGIVSAIMLAVSVASFPALNRWKVRNALVDAARETSICLNQARMEAVRGGSSVVVETDTENRTINAFANVDGDGDLSYEPREESVHPGADYAVATCELPRDSRVSFIGPSLIEPGPGEEGEAASGVAPGPIVGFTPNGRGDRVAVFGAKGSLDRAGAIRVGDPHGNVLEVRVALSGKIEVLKYVVDPPWGGETGFYPNLVREETKRSNWIWY